MSKRSETLGVELLNSRNEGMRLMERLLNVAHVSSVFGSPHSAGDQIVMTASEVFVGMGFGFGGGGASAPEAAAASGTQSESGGYGTGGGGGGFSAARPVAVISVGPQGVSVRPVFDVAKLAVAFFTFLISMAAMMARFRRASR